MSRGWGPKQRRSPPEGVHVAYPLTEAVLARLSPPRLAALYQSLREFRRHVGGHRRLRELERRRVQRRVEDLGSHFLHVDPRNRLVAADLEVKLEGAMRELAAAKAADGHAQPSAPLTDADLDDLLMLANDLPALFHAITTTNRDRKEIVRTVVQRVSIVERTPECVVATVNWNDGADGTVLRILWDAHAHRRIAELAAAGASLKEICIRLGEEQLITRRGNPWTPNAVSMVLRRKHIALSSPDAVSSLTPTLRSASPRSP